MILYPITTTMTLKSKFFKPLFVIILLCSYIFAQAQFTSNTTQTFNAAASFIENIGQYGTTYKGKENMGSILYGFEGHSMPILFTKKGLIYLHRKVESISKEEEKKLEKKGVSEAEIEQKKIVTDRTITMEWLGANNDVEIIQEAKTYDYHTYGFIKEKAYGYKKITYKNLYNGIDLVYSFTNNSKIGFEYSLHVAAGADISQIKMQYGGDVKTIKTNKQGNLIIESDIDRIQQSTPITYYTQPTNDKQQSKNEQTTNSKPTNEQQATTQQQIKKNKQRTPNNKPQTKNNIKQTPNNILTTYNILNNQVNFVLNENYDNSKSIIIDPFISSTSNLDGLNSGKAKDIDFDYAGNLYVTGGGDIATNHRLAKYNDAGVLQWTFNGVLTTPVWEFGQNYGGWIVEKQTGKIYLGNGISAGLNKIIRLNTNGIYDNYISNGTNFSTWKMLWNCNNGNPEILAGSGGASTNIGFYTLSPTSQSLTFGSLTGSNITNQNIVDFVVDPTNNELYSIFASINGSPVNNGIYKNARPYNPANLLWSTASGYNTLAQRKNRPYLVTNPNDDNDNSANMLAVNRNYLFYWDGKSLKAFDKVTGAAVGTTVVTTNTAKMCGGIYADGINNVWVGSVNGSVKVFTFNGTTFVPGYDIYEQTNDPAIPNGFIISGYETKSVYDLTYNATNNILYASGDGFIADLDLGIFIPNVGYAININKNCQTASATVTLTPTPPATTVVTYTLFIGTTQITSNNTGIFTSLIPLTNYTIIATLNAACSGYQITKNFTVTGPTITTTPTNEICGNSAGQIVAVGSSTLAPYTYSINGTNFFSTGTFTGLAANTYTITVKDGNGCINTKQVVVANNSFTPTFITTYSGTTCGNSTGTIDATPNGGVAPYEYSINNGGNYQANSIFAGLSAGQYQLRVRDANGCLSNMVLVDITPSFGVGITALPTNSTCGLANGKITATAIGGAAPYEYSINGGTTYQPTNVFNGLPAGPYTIRIRDANTCTNNTVIITVGNTAGATVTASSQNSTCGNANGIITAIRNGGTPNFEFSKDDGLTYQAANNNVFTNLAASAIPYKIKVRDGNNCVSPTFNVIVSNTAGAIVTATSQNSTCGNANGIITATRVGGTANFEFSKDDGLTYQPGNNNVFTNLGASAIPYKIKVRDGNNCISPAFDVVVSNTAGATVTAISQNSTCGNANGIITATRIGGTANFEFSKDDGLTYQAANNNVFTNLAASATPYKIKVRDGNSCISPAFDILVLNTAGATVTATSQNSTCGNANGIITAARIGGTANFEFSKDDGLTYQAANNNVFTNLAASAIPYKIKVRDGNSCISPAFDIIVSNTAGATVTATADSSICGFTNGKITATSIGGTASFDFSKDDGLTFQPSDVFNNIAPSAIPYKIKVRDGNNCISPAFDVLVGNKPSATVTATSQNATCGYSNGKIFAIPNGQYPPFSYSIDGGVNYQNVANFNNLAPIPYIIFIKDNNSCVTSFPITVTATPVPILNVFAGKDTEVVIKQPLQLNAIDVNNIGFVRYTWSPSFGLNRPDIKNPISILDKDFAYEVVATTADGCLAKDSIKIKISFTSEIYVPTGFTPNGDGKNDVLRPRLVGVKALKYFAVYNKYGALIYKSANESQGWDGTINGAAQNTGSFVWVAEAVDYLGNTIFRKGISTLVR
jgi:gliding motility-associated-like protein